MLGKPPYLLQLLLLLLVLLLRLLLLLLLRQNTERNIKDKDRTRTRAIYCPAFTMRFDLLRAARMSTKCLRAAASLGPERDPHMNELSTLTDVLTLTGVR
jgi:hypothetical protein